MKDQVEAIVRESQPAHGARHVLDFHPRVIRAEHQLAAQAPLEHRQRNLMLHREGQEIARIIEVQRRRIQRHIGVFERQGLAYLTFIVADINEVTARLTEHEVKLVRPEPVEVRKGFVALFAEDPEGNFVEFVEYDDISTYRPDLHKQG